MKSIEKIERLKYMNSADKLPSKDTKRAKVKARQSIKKFIRKELE
jgi:hypothetical protein